MLLTGGAGQVAQALVAGADPRLFTFRALDIVPTPNVPDHIVASCTDASAVLAAAEGVDAIVHLTHAGGEHGNAPLETVDYAGAVAVFEAARQHCVARVGEAPPAALSIHFHPLTRCSAVFASRAGVVGGWQPTSPHPADTTRVAGTLNPSATVPTVRPCPNPHCLATAFGLDGAGRSAELVHAVEGVRRGPGLHVRCHVWHLRRVRPYRQLQRPAPRPGAPASPGHSRLRPAFQ